MPKPSTAGFDLKTIRGMLTAAERRVFESSIGKEIAAAGREQLQAAIGQARTLRDKWRDLYAKQTRTTKRSATSAATANDRSREKSELFAGAIERLESRLAEFGVAAKTAVKSVKKAAAKAVAAPASKKRAAVKVARSTPKKVRTAGHRATRAGVKAELKEVVAKKSARR